MRSAVVLLLGIALCGALAAEESCVQRCGTFNPGTKCQCDSMCVYYGSCCPDYESICPKKARGDTFADEEDVTEMATTEMATTEMATTEMATTEMATTEMAIPVNAPSPTQTEAPVTVASVPVFSPTQEPTTPEPMSPGPFSEDTNPNLTTCSGQSFDAFLQVKNGSIYAFRGEYFFELDDTTVLPGYPKVIEDVWGIPGPIDAAFTRINCQGKSYIFKGNQYWRFDGDAMDGDYPRDISVGFDGIPSDMDAAFAVPAPSHRGKEKAYFFKDDKYYEYQFKQQPSHQECVEMTRSSPSLLFTRYTDLFCDRTFEGMFSELFGPPPSSITRGPRLISQDWVGLSYPVDAAMVGRVKLAPKPTPRPATKGRPYKNRRPNKRRNSRKTRHALFEDILDGIFDDLFDYEEYTDYPDLSSSIQTHQAQLQQVKPTPVQNVYFFKKDKYTRVDLKRKRVDSVRPPYPRSIAKYWLGCESEETPDTSRAEK